MLIGPQTREPVEAPQGQPWSASSRGSGTEAVPKEPWMEADSAPWSFRKALLFLLVVLAVGFFVFALVVSWMGI